MKKLLTILMISLLFSACDFSIKEPEFRRIKSFNVEKEDKKISLIRVGVLIHNPNDYAIKVKKYNLSFYLNDMLIGHSVSNETAILEKEQESEVIFPVETSSGNLKKGLIPFLLSFLTQDEKKFYIKGKATVSAKSIRKTVDIDHSEKADLEKLLQKLTGR